MFILLLCEAIITIWLLCALVVGMVFTTMYILYVLNTQYQKFKIWISTKLKK